MATAGSEVPRWARLDSPLLREMESAIIVTDLAGTIQSCNPHAEVFFGRPASELIGRDSADFAAEPVAEDLAHEIYDALRAGRTWQGEFAIRRKDGAIVTAHVVDSPLHDDRGELVGVASMALDLTARRHAENRLRAQYEIARTLGEAHSIEEASETAPPNRVRGARLGHGRAVGTRHRTVGPALPCHLALARQQAAAFEDLSARTTFRMGRGLPGRVWARGTPAWIPDVARDTNFTRSEVAAADGLHGGFGVPIRRGRDVLGVIEFFAAESREPDDEVLEMMDAAGAQIGQFIERTETERELRASQAGLAQLADTLQQSLLPPHFRTSPASRSPRTTRRRETGATSAATSTTCSKALATTGRSSSVTSAAKAPRRRHSQPWFDTRPVPPPSRLADLDSC